MKKYLSYFEKNKSIFISFVLLLLGAVTGTDVLLADIGVVEPGNPTASSGQSGLETQLPGEATTVGNASEAGGDLIQPDIDDMITQIASDESVTDTIKRRCKRQVQVTSFEVDHFLMDEKRSKSITITAYAGVASTKQAELSISEDDYPVFQEYYTAIAKGVDGYSEDGSEVMPGQDLMLYVVGKTAQDKPIVRAINGPKVNKTDAYCYVPTIPVGTEIILLSSAGYETQKFIAPSTVLPVPERMFLQKQLCNSIVSDYFKAQKKRIPFSEATIAEAIVRQFRLESCRTAWIGQKGKIKVNAQDKTLGQQFVYFSLGMRWQLKREYELSGKISLEDLINLSMVKFTGYDCSKSAIWIVGKILLADIQKIDLTLHKDISMVSSEAFGIKCTKIHTVFGDIHLVHDPALDRLGYSKCGALIDEKDLVRYWMKNEERNSEDVEGEEAKRDIVMTIDCLCLKGYSHIWVNGNGLTSNSTVKVSKANTLPSTPRVDQVIILGAAVSAGALTNNVAFANGDIVTWTGKHWVAYNGEIYAANS